MNKYAQKWYDLDQFIGLCLDEDMMEFYPSLTCRESANLAIRDFFVTQPHAQIAQVRLELMQLLAERHSEAELEAILLDMGNAWDFSPYRDFLNSVLVQIEEFLGIHRPPPATGQQPPAPPPQSVHPRETLKPNWSIGQFFLFLGIPSCAIAALIYFSSRADTSNVNSIPAPTRQTLPRRMSMKQVRAKIRGRWYWQDGSGYLEIKSKGECIIGNSAADPYPITTKCRLEDSTHFGFVAPKDQGEDRMSRYQITDLSEDMLRLLGPDGPRILLRRHDSQDNPDNGRYPSVQLDMTDHSNESPKLDMHDYSRQDQGSISPSSPAPGSVQAPHLEVSHVQSSVSVWLDNENYRGFYVHLFRSDGWYDTGIPITADLRLWFWCSTPGRSSDIHSLQYDIGGRTFDALSSDSVTGLATFPNRESVDSASSINNVPFLVVPERSVETLKLRIAPVGSAPTESVYRVKIFIHAMNQLPGTLTVSQRAEQDALSKLSLARTQ